MPCLVVFDSVSLRLGMIVLRNVMVNARQCGAEFGTSAAVYRCMVYVSVQIQLNCCCTFLTCKSYILTPRTRNVTTGATPTADVVALLVGACCVYRAFCIDVHRRLKHTVWLSKTRFASIATCNMRQKTTVLHRWHPVANRPCCC